MQFTLASCLHLTYGYDRCRIARIADSIVQAQNTRRAVGGSHRPASADGKKRPRQSNALLCLLPICRPRWWRCM